MCNHINLKPYLKPDTPFAKFYKELWDDRQFFVTNLIASMVASLLPITPKLFMKILMQIQSKTKNTC